MPFEYTTAVSKFWGANPQVPDGPAKNAPLWRKVFDRLLALRDGVLGRLEWSGDFAVSGSAANNFTVTLGAISCAWVIDGSSNYVPLAYAGGTIDQTAVQGGGGTLGAAVDWWHVYIYSNGGSAAFEISQTAPTGNRVFKTGDNTRRYLGRFRTNGSGVPLAVTAARGHYLYRVDQAVKLSGNDTSRTAVIVRPDSTTEESLIPTDVKLARMYFQYDAQSGGDRTLSIYNANTSTVSTTLAGKNVGAAQTIQAEMMVEVDSSQQFAYATSSGASTMNAYCRGWVE